MQRELFSLLDKIKNDNKKTYKKLIKFQEDIADEEIEKVLQIFCKINITPEVKELEPKVIIQHIDYRGIPTFKNVLNFEFAFNCTENMKNYILAKIPDFEDNIENEFKNTILGSWDLSQNIDNAPTIRRESITPVAPEPPTININYERRSFTSNDSVDRNMTITSDGNIHINADRIELRGEPGQIADMNGRIYPFETLNNAMSSAELNALVTNQDYFGRELFGRWED